MSCQDTNSLKSCSSGCFSVSLFVIISNRNGGANNASPLQKDEAGKIIARTFSQTASSVLQPLLRQHETTATATGGSDARCWLQSWRIAASPSLSSLPSTNNDELNEANASSSSSAAASPSLIIIGGFRCSLVVEAATDGSTTALPPLGRWVRSGVVPPLRAALCANLAQVLAQSCDSSNNSSTDSVSRNNDNGNKGIVVYATVLPTTTATTAAAPLPRDSVSDVTSSGYGVCDDAVDSAKVLMVGAGGIGCELAKCIALRGFRDISVLDLDTVDATNLNRQFLFRQAHVGSSKAAVVAEALQQWHRETYHLANNTKNNNHNSARMGNGSGGGRSVCYSAKPLKTRALCANIKDAAQFDVDFFQQFSVVVNGLDNVSARRHVNRMCAVAGGIPLVESGTAGYNGQCQPILFKPAAVSAKNEGDEGGFTAAASGSAGNLVFPRTACYDCQERPPDRQSFAVCTVHARPTRMVHCVHFAKEIWERLFGGSGGGGTNNQQRQPQQQQPQQPQQQQASSPALSETDFLAPFELPPSVASASSTGSGGVGDDAAGCALLSTATSSTPSVNEAGIVSLLELLFVRRIDALNALRPASSTTTSTTSTTETTTTTANSTTAPATTSSSSKEPRALRSEVASFAASTAATTTSQCNGSSSTTNCTTINADLLPTDFAVPTIMQSLHQARQAVAAAVARAATASTDGTSSTNKNGPRAQILERFPFKKEDPIAVAFVVAVANLRATCFHIPPETPHALTSLAGNIIPAIATTNAIVAAAVANAAVLAVTLKSLEKATTHFEKPHDEQMEQLGDQQEKATANTSTTTGAAMTLPMTYIRKAPQSRRRRVTLYAPSPSSDSGISPTITIKKTVPLREELLLHTLPPPTPSPACLVCGAFSSTSPSSASTATRTLTIRLNARLFTVGAFVKRILMERLALVAPTIAGTPPQRTIAECEDDDDVQQEEEIGTTKTTTTNSALDDNARDNGGTSATAGAGGAEAPTPTPTPPSAAIGSSIIYEHEEFESLASAPLMRWVPKSSTRNGSQHSPTSSSPPPPIPFYFVIGDFYQNVEWITKIVHEEVVVGADGVKGGPKKNEGDEEHQQQGGGGPAAARAVTASQVFRRRSDVMHFSVNGVEATPLSEDDDDNDRHNSSRHPAPAAAPPAPATHVGFKRPRSPQ